jgi:hypothetical protein
MGGHKNTSNSSMNNESSFKQQIPDFQKNALTQLYDMAANIFGSTNNATQQQVPGVANFINEVNQSAAPTFRANLNGGAYRDLNIGNRLMDSLQESLGKPTNTQKIYADIMGGEGNNYADALKASFEGDANRATDNMLANLDARAAASGMSGGSRHGIATTQGLYDINSNLQKNLADVGYNTFDKDLTNKLNIASQADSNTLQRQQLMEAMLGKGQDVSSNTLGQAGQIQNLGMGMFAPTMIPWQNMSNYANVIGSPTVLSSGVSRGSGDANSKAKGGGFMAS